MTQEDRDDILSREWLNDSVINAAQSLLKYDPGLLPVGSLQNTLLIVIRQCDIVCDESVQILHSGGNHWITISTEQLTVKIYNSLDNELPQETKQQVAALLNTRESAIAFEHRPVQVNST